MKNLVQYLNENFVCENFFDDAVKKSNFSSVDDIKNDFKNHKYTIFAADNDSSLRILIIDNSKFDNVDDAFKNTVGKDTLNAAFEESHYDLDKVIKRITKEKKTYKVGIGMYEYSFGKDKEYFIPSFCYLDKIPSEEIYKFTDKFYSRGKLMKSKIKGVAYEYYDNLWKNW